jgi:hypothetical protein
MKLPNWAIALFKIRNAIVKVFGLKTDMKKGKEHSTFFTLIEKNDDEIVMGESDKHLDFRASIKKDAEAGTIALITVVHFNNVWGKVYFFPVKPFHKMIIRAMMKRYYDEK